MNNNEMARKMMLSIVMRQSWRFFRKSKIISFSNTLKLSWLIIRGKRLRYSKVVGVSKNNNNGISRQKILERLALYPEEMVSLRFELEPENLHDSNCIRIMAGIRDGAFIQVGYLSYDLSQKVSPLLRHGFIALVFFQGISGNEVHGLNFCFALIPDSISPMSVYHNNERSPQIAS